MYFLALCSMAFLFLLFLCNDMNKLEAKNKEMKHLQLCLLFPICQISSFLIFHTSSYCEQLLVAADIVAWYCTLLRTSGTLWLHYIWKMVQINLCLKSSHF